MRRSCKLRPNKRNKWIGKKWAFLCWYFLVLLLRALASTEKSGWRNLGMRPNCYRGYVTSRVCVCAYRFTFYCLSSHKPFGARVSGIKLGCSVRTGLSRSFVHVRLDWSHENFEIPFFSRTNFLLIRSLATVPLTRSPTTESAVHCSEHEQSGSKMENTSSRLFRLPRL